MQNAHAGSETMTGEPIDPRALAVAVFLARDEGHDVPDSGEGIDWDFIDKARRLLSTLDEFDAAQG
jgi:hypothetical protein